MLKGGVWRVRQNVRSARSGRVQKADNGLAASRPCGFRTVITVEVPGVKDENGQTATVTLPWPKSLAA